MYRWVQKPATSTLFSCQTPATKNLSFPLSSLYLASLPAPSQCICCPSMAEVRPLLQLAKSRLPLLFLLLLLAISNTAECFHQKKLDLINFRRRGHQSCIHSSFPQKSRSRWGVTMLEMRRHGFCSGIGKNWDARIQEQLVADDFRVKSVQLRMRNPDSGLVKHLSEAQIPLKSGAQLLTLNYFVEVELGGKKMALIVDTGSELTWVQCNPCRSCYTQEAPFFDPQTSRSYRWIPCNSSICGSLESATGISGVCGTDRPTCNYKISYGDGSHSSGELGSDSLIFGRAIVENFTFGCGENNQGLYGEADGLMGLGRSQLSLVAQTSHRFGGVFSYCLPSAEDSGTSGSLILGFNFSVYRNTTPISFTQMVSNPQIPTLYPLNLTGISVGSAALQASMFSDSRGVLIDSGTVITRLPPSAYKALRDEFLRQFAGYPSAPAFQILDTCFNLSTYKKVSIPILKLHFGGDVEVPVHVSGVLYFVREDASLACLALTSLSSEDEISIIGNYQQKNLRIVYDTKDSRVGFGEEICMSE